MKLHKLILAGILSLSTVSAFANWQPYVGIGLGVLSGSFNTNVSNPPLFSQYYPGTPLTNSNPGPYNFSITSQQFSPSVQLGLSNQYNKFYLGFEANLWYNNTNYNSPLIADTIRTPGGAFVNNAENQVVSDLRFSGSLDTELGYFLLPKFMPFVKVGIATSEAGVTYNFNDAADADNGGGGNLLSTSTRAWMFGPTASLGAQYSFTQNFRGFAEVNYVKMWGSATPTPTNSAYSGNFGGTASAFKQEYTFSSWELELGTNYYF